MSGLYMALWLAVEAGSSFWDVGGLADLVFFPAFVRVIGFLLIGLWIIPSLWLAFAILTLVGAMAYPGLDLVQQLELGVFVALGGPLALALIVRLAKISTDLVDVSVRDIIIFSLTCAAGNAIFYYAGLTIMGFDIPGLNLGVVIFIGDVMGSIIMLVLTLGTLRMARGRVFG